MRYRLQQAPSFLPLRSQVTWVSDWILKRLTNVAEAGTDRDIFDLTTPDLLSQLFLGHDSTIGSVLDEIAEHCERHARNSHGLMVPKDLFLCSIKNTISESKQCHDSPYSILQMVDERLVEGVAVAFDWATGARAIA
jgi:hypothetical protein